jgi:hypothetical protein
MARKRKQTELQETKAAPEQNAAAAPEPPVPTKIQTSVLETPNRPPRHNSQNFYTSLLEQKKVRYKVNKWLADHGKYDLHSAPQGVPLGGTASDTAEGCWKCNLAKDFQCGDVNLFEAWYLMKHEKKHGATTCPKRTRLLFHVGANTPAVRCVQAKNGWCRCQDWANFDDGQ